MLSLATTRRGTVLLLHLPGLGAVLRPQSHREPIHDILVTGTRNPKPEKTLNPKLGMFPPFTASPECLLGTLSIRGNIPTINPTSHPQFLGMPARPSLPPC